MARRLPTAFLTLVLVAATVGACAAGSGGTPAVGGATGTGGKGAGGSAQGGSAGIAQGGTVFDIDASPPAGGAGPAWIPADLPRPWQYYDKGTDRAYKDPALGAGVKDQFGGTASTTGAPGFVYPLDNAMHPLNLGEITFQWHQGATTNTLFRIDAVGADNRTSRFYVPCKTANCEYPMPESDWLWLAADYAGNSVTITISGTDGKGGPVATSTPITAHFSPEPVYGALYYWAAHDATIKRAAFGAKKAVPFIVPSSATDQFACAACHSVSRDGKVISFSVSNLRGETVGAIQTAPTQDPTKPFVAPAMGTSPYSAADANVPTGGTLTNQPLDHFGHMSALSPDGSLMIVNGIPAPASDGSHWPPYIEIRDTKSGATIKHYNLGDPLFGRDAQTLPILPEWSPDGKSIVVSMGTFGADWLCLWTYDTCNAPIAIMPVVGGNSLGAAQTLVTNTDTIEFDYYPSWSPDGQWVVFQSAKNNIPKYPQTSLSDWNGVIRMVRATGGPYVCPGKDCIELTNGTQYSVADAWAGKGKHAAWPKFSPFAQGKSKNIMFVSYTSAIDYGFLATNKSQLWMFAVDVSKAGSGDPSYAPIWLPYQDYTDGSLNPYWTETLPCTVDNSGGCSGCVNGESCVLLSSGACECQGVVLK